MLPTGNGAGSSSSKEVVLAEFKKVSQALEKTKNTSTSMKISMDLLIKQLI